ncbi:hypothetical protein AcW1_000098 [Taiwanofungus camphoratus]|nr:hypothetical protein AcW2_001409 [Antrodia cinnamomea]KAI0962841.1 hypothetical protein AcW1_000098 [Antrodia cinnamomea]
MSSLDELLSLEAALASARTHIRIKLNSYHPMIRLPREVLCQIFQYTLQCRAAVAAWHTTSLDSSQVIPVARVCRHWREVALRMPSLWSHIGQLTNTSEVPILLTRSAISPLSVFTSLPPAPSISALFGSHSSRIRTLHCEVHRPGAVLDFLDFHGLELQNFTLDFKDSRFNAKSNPVLFSGQIPRLKSLALRKVPWLPANEFKSLTHLCITGHHFNSLSTLTDFLSGIPLLTDLVLVSVNLIKMRRGVSTAVRGGQTIALDNLRRFAIGLTHDSFSFVTSLLYHLVLPTNIALRLFRIEPGRLSFLGIMPRFKWINDLTKLSISLTEASSKASKYVGDCSFIAASRSSVLRVDFQFETFEDTRQKWIAYPIELFPKTNLQELRLNLTGEFPINYVEPMLKAASSVTKLVICERISNGRSPMMVIIKQMTTPWKTPLPNLSSLHIVIDRWWPYSVGVTRFAREREKFGRRLKELLVQYTERPKSDLDQTVAAHVDSVEFKYDWREPSMELPEIYTEETHAFWPCS